MVPMKIILFWIVTTCSLVQGNKGMSKTTVSTWKLHGLTSRSTQSSSSLSSELHISRNETPVLMRLQGLSFASLRILKVWLMKHFRYSVFRYSVHVFHPFFLTDILFTDTVSFFLTSSIV